jgi:hypothetical protein
VQPSTPATYFPSADGRNMTGCGIAISLADTSLDHNSR